MKALSIRQLTKTYKNSLQALKGIDFDVEAGDFFALLGPNGAGKSTMIGIITSLVNKTSGKVSIFGVDIDQDFSKAKALIGIVPQEFNFNVFHTVETIVMTQAGYYGVPRKLARERAQKYLKLLQLWDKRHQRARSLSGGMKRRLMIARAMMHEPKMLILDEPTAGVDIEIRRSTWEFLSNLNRQGVTIILTTHYLEEAENLCRNIAIINHGKIIEHTSMANILQKLSSERFILYLKNHYKQLPEIDGYDFFEVDESTLEVEVPAKQGLDILFQRLAKEGLQISSLRNKANRLEELFLRLTTDTK